MAACADRGTRPQIDAVDEGRLVARPGWPAGGVAGAAFGEAATPIATLWFWQNYVGHMRPPRCHLSANSHHNAILLNCQEQRGNMDLPNLRGRFEMN